MKSYDLSEDSKAILMLFARLKSHNDFDSEKPLSLTEYNNLAAWLVSRKLRPADLLHEKGQYELKNEGINTVNPDRIIRLLGRGATLAFATERWMNKGIWILSRSDPEYPLRLRDHLNNYSPPILFGIGDTSLLNLGGLAIVGSRNIDLEGESFTSDLGNVCANLDFQVISGGARGVDQLAMKSALDNQGSAIAVLADSLMRWSTSAIARQAIREGRLALVSPYNPEAPFNVGNAMQRNKYIYALADYALVVSADFQRGGTWAGAEEELNRTNHIPVFIRKEGNVPNGNIELMKKGALSFPQKPWDNSLKDLLANTAQHENPSPKQLSLINPPKQDTTSDDSNKH